MKSGYPELRVLDTTDPAMITRLSRGLDLTKALFLVSSKSGGTPESVCLQKYFHQRLRRAKGDRAGENFVAITDPGTSLERLATQQGFRRTFLNFRDMVGRFAALSYVGMVPAALIGVDVRALLSRAQRMARQCAPAVPLRENPGAQLGAILGELADHGRDKLTLVLPSQLRSFGSWVEQLVSESTGKAGGGIVVIDGEDVGSPAVYGRDRGFVALELPDGDSGVDARLLALEAGGARALGIRAWGGGEGC